jgi:hypothetical protein
MEACRLKMEPWRVCTVDQLSQIHITLMKSRDWFRIRIKVSVADPDPGCLSRIPDPDFYSVPDPKTTTTERGEKNSSHTFCCSLKFHKTGNYLIFEMLKK